MTLLSNQKINFIFHYAPLHYLPLIGRSKNLLSKNALIDAGFNETHFRSTSKRQDFKRGFSDYVHLTIDDSPGILQSKLKGGFPHFRISVPASYIDNLDYHLCRYNIAKGRYLLERKTALKESCSNGKYYPGKSIPTAETSEERESLLKANLGKNMIEVLIPNQLELPEDTILSFYNSEDLDIGKKILGEIGSDWETNLLNQFKNYKHKNTHIIKVKEFLDKSISDPRWKGNGLEFDKV